MRAARRHADLGKEWLDGVPGGPIAAGGAAPERTGARVEPAGTGRARTAAALARRAAQDYRASQERSAVSAAEEAVVRRYLIAANQRLGGDALAKLIRRRAAAEPSGFFLVVPATPVLEMVPGAVAAVTVGGPAVLASPPAEGVGAGREAAGRGAGAVSGDGRRRRGAVGDGNPVRAVETAMTGRSFDEIVASTLPSRLSRWLRADLPRRLELPAAHVAAPG